jgi:hypothetical protein
MSELLKRPAEKNLNENKEANELKPSENCKKNNTVKEN